MRNLFLLIAAGGAGGAVARFLLASLVQNRASTAFPLGTFLVNVSGCFVFGLLYFVIIDRSTLSPELRSLLFIGFLGGYTTFSSWAFETLQLLTERSYAPAVLYGLGSPVAGLVAIWAGSVLAKILARLAGMGAR